MTATQESVDAFYWKQGPCCAGCDWWKYLNAVAGDCTATPPNLSSDERGALLGLHGSSLNFGAGHMMTNREHHCGSFKDEFDWSSLNLAYLKRIGAPTPSRNTP